MLLDIFYIFNIYGENQVIIQDSYCNREGPEADENRSTDAAIPYVCNLRVCSIGINSRNGRLCRFGRPEFAFK